MKFFRKKCPNFFKLASILLRKLNQNMIKNSEFCHGENWNDSIVKEDYL